MIAVEPIRTDSNNKFAHLTMVKRNVKIIKDIIARSAFSPSVNHRLEYLAESIKTNQKIPEFEMPYPDYDEWYSMYQKHKEDSWLNTDWFFAENFMYRQIIQHTNWWSNYKDPFEDLKLEDLYSKELKHFLESTMFTEGSNEDILVNLFETSLWGNRSDASYREVKKTYGLQENNTSYLLVDDREQLINTLLDNKSPGMVHIVTDNSGVELAADTLLAKAIYEKTFHRVTLHVKWHPTFVSDATVFDFNRFLHFLVKHNAKDIRQFGVELENLINHKYLIVVPDMFWNSPKPLDRLPLRLVNTFQKSVLVILKGDANYRRMVSDKMWPSDISMNYITKSFPSPLAAIRTLKSDPIIGLPSGFAEKLDNKDSNWRTNGKRGVIQFSK